MRVPVAVLSALKSYNWPPQTERFHLLELFAQFLFSHLSRFQTVAGHITLANTGISDRAVKLWY
jgi:hypothetical protein